MSYVGRLAPSPTGAQHIGNARTYLVAWLECRQAGGRLLLRIEDLDTPRTKPGAVEKALEDLRWLGLDWDSVNPNQSWITQSNRQSRYVEVLEQFKLRELVYPCTCTRSDIESVASAPHESLLDGAIYPGTCSSYTSADAKRLDSENQLYAWRFRMPDGEHRFVDRISGLQTLWAKQMLGDFVVARSYGVIAYQLAVVIDDHDFKINHVVRGNDLIYSTYRQLAIYRALGWEVPEWMHVPLVVGHDGKRLAKRHGDSRICYYRERGISSRQMIGYLARTLGLSENGEPCNTNDLVDAVGSDNIWIQRILRSPVVFDEEHLLGSV